MTKHFFYSIILISLYSCNVINRKLERETQSSPIARQDSVDISLTPGVQYKVHKDQYKAILAVRTEFFSDAPVDPDSTYYTALDSLEDFVFASETGQDYYYLWYTYFLKKRYTHDNHQTDRERLIDLFNSMNHIYAIITRGGSFFSHNLPRIQAYAEWDIYQHFVLNSAVPISEVDFEMAKQVFNEKNRRILESSDSFKYWGGFTEEGRKATLQELGVLFDSLSDKIDNPFYLSCVLEFEERYQHLISVQ